MAKKKETGFDKWDDFLEESRVEPYRLQVSEDKTIEIDPPSGAGLIDVTEAQQTADAKRLLRGLVGDKFDEVLELLSQAGSYKAMDSLIYAIMIHFDLVEEHELVGPGGGKRKVKDPRELRRLMNQGWTLAGEANSRT